MSAVAQDSAGARDGRPRPRLASRGVVRALGCGRRPRGARPRARRRPARGGRRWSGAGRRTRRRARTTSQPRGAVIRSACSSTEVVGVRLGVGRERAEDGGAVGVDVGQGRDGAAARTRSSSNDVTDPRRDSSRRGAPLGVQRTTPYGVCHEHRTERSRAPDRRDRHGRGHARAHWPGRRSRRWPPAPAVRRLRPRRRGPAGDASAPSSPRRVRRRGRAARRAAPWDTAEVPLGRLFPAHGKVPARIVVYRRPVETRANDRRELVALVTDVVTEQVAAPARGRPAGAGPRVRDRRALTGAGARGPGRRSAAGSVCRPAAVRVSPAARAPASAARSAAGPAAACC